MRGLRRGVAIVVAAAGLFALAGTPQGQEAQESGRGYPAGEWPLVGGNWSSSRYSTLDDISRDTVERLGRGLGGAPSGRCGVAGDAGVS